MKRRHILLPLVAIATVSFLVTFNHVYAADGIYQSGGSVGFAPSTEVTPPFNPDDPNPEEPVRPIDPAGETPSAGTAGPLAIDFASSFSFGNRQIVNRDATYSAKAQALTQPDGQLATYVPNYVQVTDNRGTNAGWTLLVSQKGQMHTASKMVNQVLSGAEIALNQPIVAGVTRSISPTARVVTLDPDGAESVVMTASAGSGAGTWLTHWGNQNDVIAESQVVTGTENTEAVQVDPAITLTIPGTTPRDAVSYITTLNWTLVNVPTLVV
jgi:hypothetical protein